MSWLATCFSSGLGCFGRRAGDAFRFFFVGAGRCGVFGIVARFVTRLVVVARFVVRGAVAASMGFFSARRGADAPSFVYLPDR